MGRRKLLVISILLLLTFNIFAALNLGPIPVSAADYPAVYVDPPSTTDPGLTPGNNYTVSIMTNYTGTDITSWQFNLSYNPTVLNGINLTNGDIIVGGSAIFLPGTFDNTAGTLSLTAAFFFMKEVAPGPGTLANVTFEVVGTGESTITLGSFTNLIGWNGTAEYDIVNAGTMPDHIGHGSFNNVPPVHDVAVVALDVQSEAVVGDIVPINVTVANEGAFNESVTLTVSYDSDNISTTTFSLNTGSFEPFSIDWNTTGVVEGNYTITAEVDVVLNETDTADNIATKPIEVKTVHDVAVTALDVQSEAVVGDVVPINVTVTNVGHFEENGNLTVSYIGLGQFTLVDTANFTLSSGASEPISIDWNTTGVVEANYTIEVKATIPVDDDLSDNTDTRPIELILILDHDVAVTDLVVQSEAVVGDIVPINVTVSNEGAFNESVTLTVSYDSTNISTTTFSLDIGLSETVSFDWNTTDVDSGLRSIKAKAVIDGDANTDNNEYTGVYVVVNLPRGSVAGIVTDASTEDPIVGANVTVNGSSDITDAVGHYNITDLPVGNYTVTVSAEGYESSSDTITVTAGETTPFNVALTPVPTTGSVAGIVTDASTEDPIVGANVTVNGSSDITDAVGHYNITDLPVGNYTVTVSAEGYESSSDTITVTAGETTPFSVALTPVQPPNILPYVGGAAIAIIIVAAIAIYLLKVRKPT